MRFGLACLLVLGGTAHAEPITVRDAFDRSVTVRAPPQRIVPIFASNTEIVTSLGLGNRIVGIESFTRYPREVLDRPLVGGRLGFSVDAITALQPDLVVVTPSRQAATQRPSGSNRARAPSGRVPPPCSSRSPSPFSSARRRSGSATMASVKPAPASRRRP